MKQVVGKTNDQYADTNETQYTGMYGSFTIRRPAPGVVVAVLTGWDVGEFGDVPMKELEKFLQVSGFVELFIDARNVKGATMDVSKDWSQWLRAHRERFRHIGMLPGSRLIRITADFVRDFANLGHIMKVYTDAEAFDRRLAQAIEDGEKQ